MHTLNIIVAEEMARTADRNAVRKAILRRVKADPILRDWLLDSVIIYAMNATTAAWLNHPTDGSDPLAREPHGVEAMVRVAKSAAESLFKTWLAGLPIGNPGAAPDRVPRARGKRRSA